jgi:hypothetical protein
MVIEVKPYEQVQWGVYIDGVVFGVSKNSSFSELTKVSLNRSVKRSGATHAFDDFCFRIFSIQVIGSTSCILCIVC